MFLENYKNFILYYGKGRYLKLVGFTVLSFIAGCLEFIGVALIYPFIMLIIQPDYVKLPHFIHLDNSLITGLCIGLLVLLIFVFKNFFIVMTLYLQSKFVAFWKQNICSKFMQYYLYAPYKDTMKISANSKLYTMTTLINTVIDNFIIRGLNLLTNAIIVTMVLALLLWKFPLPAIVTFSFVCITLFVQNKFFKKRTNEISKVLHERSLKYQTSLLQNIKNIKEIKISSAEDAFYDDFIKSFSDLRGVQIINGFYAAIPPYIVETLVVVSLIIMSYILSVQNINSNSSLIASFAIVVAAMFRIAPALNRIQSSIIAINTSREFVKQLNKEHGLYEYKKPLLVLSNSDFQFNKNIELRNIHFSYNDDKEILKGISFTVEKGDFIGIIGLSGAGKSTLADVIMGLLPADSGEILVDGKSLNESTYIQFRKKIGYVPQQINILDKSVAENVAWGAKEIDESKVIQALKYAKLYDKIMEYPKGIKSNITLGSNGLSQGQKQRLAIARVLYQNPEIIILDEATSSLDVKVEHEITEMLTGISKNKTIIAIAHRLSTLKSCNKLVYMKDGVIVDIGTFEELSNRYDDFANLVKLSKIE